MITRNIQEAISMYIAFKGKNIVLRKDGKDLSLNDITVLKRQVSYDELFAEQESGICVLGINSNDSGHNDVSYPLPPEYTTQTVRLYNATQTEEIATRISRAKGLLEWIRTTKYCTSCGAPLQFHATLTAQECRQCGKLVFPRIEPCIIVLIRKGDKILLARHAQRHQNIYACIAGFMETGETAEQAVQREIMEETGLKVKNIRYFGTQSWPFPSQLMIAFTAEYESGEIKTQESEIQHAAWFRKDECPATPEPGSIAYRLIHSID